MFDIFPLYCFFIVLGADNKGVKESQAGWIKMGLKLYLDPLLFRR